MDLLVGQQSIPSSFEVDGRWVVIQTPSASYGTEK